MDIKVACRLLAEFVHRTGGLSPISFSNLEAGSGTRTHQAFYKALDTYLPGAISREEVLVKGQYKHGDITLLLNGRVDILVEMDGNLPFPLEVKTVGVPLTKIDDQGQVVHWAQVKLYAWLLVAENEALRQSNAQISFALAYVSREDMTAIILKRELAYHDLKDWFEDTCKQYLQFARNQKEYQIRSIDSIKSLRFPYESLRDGQREFMERVLRNLRSRTPLLVQAPTGTGKTMSTLYPAIKGLAAGYHKQIFYLTAKGSTGDVAADSIRVLRNTGLIIRSVQMTSKEKLCLEPEIYCDPMQCPYAKNYYKNINNALTDALTFQDFDKDLILKLAKKHRVCPFELQLDIALYADIIICDYNYAFDPRVKLDRFFAEKINHYALLVDEAHNLPDRAREMYSAELSEKELKLASEALITFDKSLSTITYPLLHYFDTLKKNILPDNSAWHQVETKMSQDAIMQADDFRATKSLPSDLIQKLWHFCHQIRDSINDIDDFEERQKVLDFYFAARYFLKVTEEFWSDRYILSAKKENGSLTIEARCVDSSDRIVQTFRNVHSAIFFSATLMPMHYFSREFCGQDYDDKPDTMTLASPFPPENLLVSIASGVETTYKERTRSRGELARTIALALIRTKGNSLVFFPSYAYMKQVLPLIKKNIQKYPIDVIVQDNKMQEREREQFLRRFSQNESNGRNLTGFAVLGGIFSEGIDLTGDALKSVIVVGVGIPQISPEREIMQQYYAVHGLGGYNFAYMYPGFNKVMQAAGRLIRSETDTGFILLIDQRYERAEYRQLFPEEWVPVFCEDLKAVNLCLEAIPDGD